jgi:hypothetical protein
MISNNNNKDIRLKVLAENEMRRIFNIMTPKIQKRLRGCVGFKIIKKDGTFIKALHEDLNEFLKVEREQLKLIPFSEGGSANISYFYLTPSTYNIYFKLQLCFSGGSYEDRTNYYYCFYWAKEYDICSLDNGKIKEFREFTPYKEINADEQINQINKCRDILEQLNKEKDKIAFYELKDYVG